MKFLILVALGALAGVLIYSRLYPYIQALKKLFTTARSLTEDGPAHAGRRQTRREESKLVRCLGCGTWVPIDRAISMRSGQSNYCSRECVEKTAAGENRRVAG